MWLRTNPLQSCNPSSDLANIAVWHSKCGNHTVPLWRRTSQQLSQLFCALGTKVVWWNHKPEQKTTFVLYKCMAILKWDSSGVPSACLACRERVGLQFFMDKGNGIRYFHGWISALYFYHSPDSSPEHCIISCHEWVGFLYTPSLWPQGRNVICMCGDWDTVLHYV